MAKDINTKQLAKEMVKELREETQSQVDSGMKTPTDNSWEAISVEEKLERTRQIVKDLQRRISYLSTQMRKMERHTHDDKGEAVTVEKLGYGIGGEEVSTTVGGSTYF